MHQTKADFLVQKYRQILRASLLVEAVSYIMTMTDTLIAGNMIGEDALAAAGLVAPLLRRKYSYHELSKPYSKKHRYLWNRIC